MQTRVLLSIHNSHLIAARLPAIQVAVDKRFNDYGDEWNSKDQCELDFEYNGGQRAVAEAMARTIWRVAGLFVPLWLEVTDIDGVDANRTADIHPDDYDTDEEFDAAEEDALEADWRENIDDQTTQDFSFGWATYRRLMGQDRRWSRWAARVSRP